MDTFCGDRDFTALLDGDLLLGRIVGAGRNALDGGNNLHAFKDLAEDDVATVEPTVKRQNALAVVRQKSSRERGRSVWVSRLRKNISTVLFV